MCTALNLKTTDTYFGRTLDLYYHYNEQVVITPRFYPFTFKNGKTTNKHYAMIGMATVQNNYPLYYEAANEKGLCIAGLNFEGNAYFKKPQNENFIAVFELIPYILCYCKNVNEAKKLLKENTIADVDFSNDLTTAPLHWIISDSEACIVVESTKSGLNIYNNPTGVLTNNPPFWYHITNLNNYINLTADIPNNRFSDKLNLRAYSKGMGGIGLPGDFSSASRFIRTVFLKFNKTSVGGEEESVSRFFAILSNAEIPKGCIRLENGKYQSTVYTCCINANCGIYYYTTQSNKSINAVGLFKENLDTAALVCYPLIKDTYINFQNKRKSND